MKAVSLARQARRPRRRGPRPDDPGADRRDRAHHVHAASAARTCTSTRCSGRSWTRATSSATSRWASSRRSAAEVTNVKAGDRVVMPFNISCGHCFMCDQDLHIAVRDDPGARAGHGRRAVRLHQALRRGARRAGRVPARPAGAEHDRSRCPRARPTSASSTSPTCCPPPGRRSSTPASPTAARVVVLGLGPIGDMSCRIAAAPRRPGDRRRPGARAARARARSAASRCIDLDEHKDDLGDAIREMTDGRGPDSVIDAVGMEAHGVAGRQAGARRWSACCPTRSREKLMQKGGVDRLNALLRWHRHRAPRRDDLAVAASTAARPTRCRC